MAGLAALKKARAKAPAPKMRDRIDRALETMRLEGMEVRAIYLTEADSKKLDREMKWKGMKVAVLDYEGHHIRLGAKSMIYSTHGVARAIPVRVA